MRTTSLAALLAGTLAAACLTGGPAAAAEERSFGEWRLGCALDDTGVMAACGLKQPPVFVLYTEPAGLLVWVGQRGSAAASDVELRVDGGEPLRWRGNGPAGPAQREAVELMRRGGAARVVWTDPEAGLRRDQEVSLEGFASALAAAVRWGEERR